MADLEKLDRTIQELELQSNELKEFNKIYAEIGKLKQDISDNLSLLKENNDGFKALSNEIESRLQKAEEQAEKLENVLSKKVQELYQDNKNFQKELDNNLTTRLEKHKSDIQLEVRNEGTQIQRAFELTLNSNFNAMESKLKEKFEQHLKQINVLKILLYIIIGLCIGIAAGFYLK
jgi:uncharacterized membrane protein YraQ (UPF0718 family)